MLYKRDYYRLDSILSISSDEDAEALLEAVNYLANWEGRGIVFDSLMPEELDTLIHIAAQYYGNYTNVLRNFLNMVYNISIYWPVNEESLLPRTSETKATKIDKHISPFVIYPNPNDGRFSVKFNLDIRDDLFYEVISPLGIVASKGSVQFNGNLNFSSLQPGIYWLRLTSSDGRSTYQCKFVIE